MLNTDDIRDQMLKLRQHLFLLVLCFGYLVSAHGQTVKPTGIIALMTDYGDKDFYVGAIKGAILSIYPQAKIVDITHQVSPYNIREGAFTLLMSSRDFPAGTIFVAVVDPGVGTARKAILLETNNGKFFIGPDNGLFTLVMREFGIKQVREIINTEWMRQGKQSTSFHGRDIFAPAAATLASGKSVEGAGPELKQYVTLPIQQAVVKNKKVIGEVIFIDRYGNIQVNFDAEMLEKISIRQGDYVKVKIGNKEKICKFVTTYGDVKVGEYLILNASTGFVEIAVNQGSVARQFNARPGSRVVMQEWKLNEQ